MGWDDIYLTLKALKKQPKNAKNHNSPSDGQIFRVEEFDFIGIFFAFLAFFLRFWRYKKYKT
jgi:hypothetical protein